MTPSELTLVSRDRLEQLYFEMRTQRDTYADEAARLRERLGSLERLVLTASSFVDAKERVR